MEELQRGLSARAGPVNRPRRRNRAGNPRGQAYVIEPGHDAWVVGDEPVVSFEFDSRTAEEYAKS